MKHVFYMTKVLYITFSLLTSYKCSQFLSFLPSFSLSFSIHLSIYLFSLYVIEFLQCRQEYKSAYLSYLTTPTTNSLSEYFNSHNAYVQQLHATNGMMDEFGKETLPQLLQVTFFKFNYFSFFFKLRSNLLLIYKCLRQ